MEELKEEKKELERILLAMNQKTESQRKLEIMELLHEYNDVKDATQVT